MDEEQKTTDAAMNAGQEAAQADNEGTPHEQSQKIVFNKEQQAEADRQITDAVANALKRRDKENAEANSKAVEAAVADALAKERERAKMSADERKNAELSEREQALADREAAYAYREFETDIKGKLLDNDLPAELSEVLARGSTKDTIDGTITPFG